MILIILRFDKEWNKAGDTYLGQHSIGDSQNLSSRKELTIVIVIEITKRCN